VLEKYIRDLATKYNSSLGSTKNYHAIIDLQSNHFQFVRIGWQEEQFIYNVLIHLSINIETGNIWILQNNTEIEIDEELKETSNIPKKSFVLGFYPAYVREQSEYAVA
jgi:hypothetical protein